jgi:glycolate oxidase FAD binding subunit
VRDVSRIAELRGGTDIAARDGDTGRLWRAASRFSSSTWIVTFMASLPPAALDAFLNATLEMADSLNGRAGIIAHPGFGVAHIGLAGVGFQAIHTVFDDLTAVVTSLEGHLILEKAPVDVKRDVDVWGPSPPSLELMARLKSEFDPDGVLNPGRFVGGL